MKSIENNLEKRKIPGTSSFSEVNVRNKSQDKKKSESKRQGKKKKKRRTANHRCTEEAVPCACALVLGAPLRSRSSSGSVSPSAETFSSKPARKRIGLEWLIRENRAGTECVYKSFKRPVKKLHRRPASAVKHKANYQLNIFRYILSCRGRRGLWSLSLFFNLCLTPFPSPLSRVVAAVGLPMTNRDEERAKHDKGSLGISFNDDRRNRKLYTPVSLSLSLSFRSFLEFRSVRDVCENQRSES